MRSFDGKPEPTPQEKDAACRALLAVCRELDAFHRQVRPRPPKPKNIEPVWLPPKEWTPEDDGPEVQDA